MAQCVGIYLRRLHIHRDIQPAGAGPAVLREIPGALKVIGDRFRVADEDGVLRDALHHADDVDFLIAELTQVRQAIGGHAGLALHLSGEDQHRDRVGPRAEDAIQRVDAAGSSGDIQDAWSVRDAGIAFRSHGGRLLMMGADVMEPGGADGVVEVHGAAAGDQKNVTRAPLFQSAEDVIR